MQTYQRVYIPVTEDDQLYGFVRLAGNGEPEQTYCCSLTPSVWVEAIGWNSGDENADDYPPDSGYFSVGVVKARASGDPFEAEDDDDAREECQGNW